MKTKLVSKNQIDEMAQCIKNQGIVAFPTETVYGLGVAYDSYEAVQKLKVAKQRPESKPFTVMVSCFEDFSRFAQISERDWTLIHHFSPGPVTYIFKRKPDLPDYITNGYETVGIRYPKDDFVLAFIRQVGLPLLVPSANLSGEPSCLTGEEVLDQLGGRIDMCVEGHCGSGVASTIVDLTGEELKIIRQGEITLAQMMEVLK